MPASASADVYKLAQALRESAGQSEITTQNVLLHSANYIKADMEARAPVRTGRMRQSIEIKVMNEGVRIGPTTDYAAYVEYGTKPHEIRPKNKKALRFRMGNTLVFAKKVNHPGTKAQPFVRPAFDAWVDTLGEMAVQANVKRFKQAAQ